MRADTKQSALRAGKGPQKLHSEYSGHVVRILGRPVDDTLNRKTDQDEDKDHEDSCHSCFPCGRAVGRTRGNAALTDHLKIQLAEGRCDEAREHAVDGLDRVVSQLRIARIYGHIDHVYAFFFRCADPYVEIRAVRVSQVVHDAVLHAVAHDDLGDHLAELVYDVVLVISGGVFRVRISVYCKS